MLEKIIWTSLVVLGTCAFATCLATSKIHSIDSIEEAQDELCGANRQTLIVFDVDETLTSNTDVGLFLVYPPENVPEHDRDFVNKSLVARRALTEKIGGDQMRSLFNSFYMIKGVNRLVEPSLPEIIRHLNAREIKVIALTKIPPGHFGSVSCGRALRFLTLLRLGIDFSASFKHQEIVFDTLTPYNGDFPVFYNGILFANYHNDKGSVLGAFFDRVGWSPQKVVFFDDYKENLEDVSREMVRRGIPFQGYWYRGAEHQARPPFDRACAEVQLDYLVRYQVLLTAFEAETIAKGKKLDAETTEMQAKK